MTYRVRIAPLALKLMDDFAAYLCEYSEDFADEQFERLGHILSVSLREAPLIWSYCPFTGPPYRAYLFRVGRRTQYWIIYAVDEESRVVDVLHFWNAARDPHMLRIV